jgi:hypothetical protein
VVGEVGEDAAAKEDDGGGEGFVAVEHLLPLFCEDGRGGEEECWGGGDGGGEGFACVMELVIETFESLERVLRAMYQKRRLSM